MLEEVSVPAPPNPRFGFSDEDLAYSLSFATTDLGVRYGVCSPQRFRSMSRPASTRYRRVVFGVGSGEAMNETRRVVEPWPAFKERSNRLAETVDLIRQLWNAERVTSGGDNYQTEKATIYDRPDQPVPIWMAAGGPRAAQLVVRIGDGFTCTGGKGTALYHSLFEAVSEGAAQSSRSPEELTNMIEIKVSYDRDAEYAMRACQPWAALALTAEEKGGTEDPLEMERLAATAADRAHTRFIVSSDPHDVVKKIGRYVELGFTELVCRLPGEDQNRQIGACAEDMLPLLQERWG